MWNGLAWYVHTKEKKRREKKRGKVLQRNEDETSKVPFSVAFCLKALFSLVPRKTRTSVSLLVGKARFYHTWRDRREKKRRYPRFISKRDSWKFHPRGNGSSKPDPTCCAMIFFFMAKGFLLAKFPLSSFGWISFVRSSKIFPTFCPKDNWLDNR